MNFGQSFQRDCSLNKKIQRRKGAVFTLRLRKRTKRTLQIVLMILLILMMLMPVCINFVPQQSTGIDPRLLAEMQTAQEEPEKKIEGSYQITDFVNGNCFTILFGQEPRDVKLIGIKDNSCSAEELENFIADDMVDLAFDRQQEDDGKLLAYAYRADGTFINQEMLARGLAEMKEEKKNTLYAEDFRLAQEAAKGKGIGSWAKE